MNSEIFVYTPECTFCHPVKGYLIASEKPSFACSQLEVEGGFFVEKIYNAYTSGAAAFYCHENFASTLAALLLCFSSKDKRTLNCSIVISGRSRTPDEIACSFLTTSLVSAFLKAFDSNVIVCDNKNVIQSFGLTRDLQTQLTELPEYVRRIKLSEQFYIESRSADKVVYVRMISKKIDVFGNYLDFHGMTIVSHAEDDPRLQMLVEECQKQLGEHYSILPYKSMHMTVFNLFTQPNSTDKKTLECYKTKVQKYKAWAKMWVPEITNKFRVKIAGFYCDDKSVGLRVVPENLKDVLETRQTLKAITRIEDKVLDKENPFHITLGYRYNSSCRDSLRDKFDTILQNCQLGVGSFLTVKQPEVCEFNDMRHFEPVHRVDHSRLNKVYNIFIQMASLI
jgi:hypothetical protein